MIRCIILSNSVESSKLDGLCDREAADTELRAHSKKDRKKSTSLNAVMTNLHFFAQVFIIARPPTTTKLFPSKLTISRLIAD